MITPEQIEAMSHDETVKGHSVHMVDGQRVEVARDWHRGKLEALYHEQEWGQHSTAEHELHGTYRTNQTKELHVPDPNGSTREELEPVEIDSPDIPGERITVYRKTQRPEMTAVHVPVTVTVSHLEAGPTGGPEFKLEWSDGFAVTVMDDATALQYLVACGAAEPSAKD